MQSKFIIFLLVGWILMAGYTLYSIRSEQSRSDIVQPVVDATEHDASIIQAYIDSKNGAE